MSAADEFQTPAEIKPEADTILAALAVMESFQQRDFNAVDAIIECTDPRELVMGLLDVSLILTDFLANASQSTKAAVVAKVREDVVGLVNTGQLGAGVTRI